MAQPTLEPSDQETVSLLGLWIRFVDALDERPGQCVDGGLRQPGPPDHQREGLETIQSKAPHQCVLGTIDGNTIGLDRAALGNVGLLGRGPVQVLPLLQRVEQAGTGVRGIVRGEKVVEGDGESDGRELSQPSGLKPRAVIPTRDGI